MYINCHTYYSLRYGTIKPEDLLSLAAEKGLKTLALTDINSTSACLDFVRLSEKYSIKPVLGIDFRNGAQQQFIALAQNNHGFQSLNKYLSIFKHDGALKIPDHAMQMEHTFIIYPYGPKKNYTLKANEYIGVKPKALNKLKLFK